MSEAAANPDLSPEAAVVIEAMRVSQEFAIDQALHELTRFAYDADNSTQALLSIHGRYGWPVSEVASVLLAVSQQDKPSETIAVTICEPSSDIEPLAITLDDGTRLATPQSERQVDVPVEQELPDGWNTSYPHSAEELSRRAEIAEDIAIYLATGVGVLMQAESPMRMLEAAPLIERFSRYAEDCEHINQLTQPAQSQLNALAQHIETLRDLYWTNVGLREFGDITTEALLEAIHEAEQVRPTPIPSRLRRIPTLGQPTPPAFDEASLEHDSQQAHHQLELLGYKGLRTVKVGSIALRDAWDSTVRHRSN